MHMYLCACVYVRERERVEYLYNTIITLKLGSMYSGFVRCMYSVLSLEKYLGAKGSFQSCVFCLDCSFGNHFDYW